MGFSVTRQLLDKLHDLLKECETDAEVLHYLDQSNSSLRCIMRRIKFVTTFLFCRNACWNEHTDLVSLFDETSRCLCIFESRIPGVFECDGSRRLAYVLLDSFSTISLLVKKIELLYGRLKNTPNPVWSVDGDVFDEFAASVQEYLMNVPVKPIGWVNFASDYGEVEANYAATVQQLECFRYKVCNISMQCTDRKKLQTILARAASILISILHMAYTNDVYRVFTGSMEKYIIGCSFDMTQEFLPRNPGAMAVCLEALLADVVTIKASKLSSSRAQVHLKAESFLNLLQSAQNQVQLVGEILDLPIMDLEINKQVEIWLKRGYAVVVREALAGSPFSSTPNHVVLSNLLHKLHLIKDQLFVLELHNHKASLTSLGSLATVRGCCKCLSLFFKTPRVRLEGMDNLILALIEFSLIETRSLCDSYPSNQFSEDMILESSFAIFKLFKAEATVMVLIDSSSSLKFLAEFRLKTFGKLASRAASFMCTRKMNQPNRKLLGVSIRLLFDKFHDFLNKCVSSSVPWDYERSARRAIKFLKTFSFYYDADWSGLDEAEHFAYLCEGTKTYFRWLICEISKVFDHEDHRHLDSALTQSVVAVDLVRINVGEMYDELKKVPHPAIFVDSVVFDEFADSVQQYLVNIPHEPVGWGRSPHDYGEVEGNYKDTVQRLKHLRYLVCSFSKQCTDQKKLQYLLDGSTAMVFSILHMAHRNDVRHTLTVEEEEHIFHSSYDMAQRFSPQNQDAMKLYLEVLSANMKASEPSSRPFDLMTKSFRNFLQSVQNQAHSLGHILDFPIMYFIVDNLDDHSEQVEILLQQYAVIAREAGYICSPISNHVFLSNLLQKLNLIKAEVFFLELHNHKSSLAYVSENRAVPIKEALISLSQFFKTPEVRMEAIEKLILVLIEAFLREAGSFCDSLHRRKLSEAMIVESSLAIFKLFKAEALLMLLTLNAFSLKFLAEFHIETLHKSLIFLRESLSDPTNDSLTDANILSVCENLATKAASFVFSFGDSNRELDQPMQLNQMPPQGPWSLFNNFPKSDGVVFAEHILGKLRKLVTNKPESYAFMKDEIDSLLKELKFFMSFLKDVKREDRKNNDLVLRVTGLVYDAEYVIEMFLCRDVLLCYLQLVLFITVEEAKVIKTQILDNCHDDESFELPLQDVQLSLVSETSEDNNLRTEEVIVGLDDQAKIVADQLQTGSKHLQVVSIVGMAGIGKTTLAKKVCTIFSIQYHFAVCARCCVSQVYRKRELLFEILGDLVDVTYDMKKKDDNDLALLIKQKLHGKRYLIVVDDVWSIEEWDDLKLSFPDDNKGSRILFTTRDHDVARKAGPEREPYVLHLLSPLQSWNLLQGKLFHGGECPEELLGAGKLVIEHCRGLPLAIVVIAGILNRTQMKKHQWKDIAKHLRSRIADDPEIHFMDILEFSYNYLPSYLKPCYLYLGSFSEDQEIPVRKLLWLWMGEGFIPKLDCKSLEETAEGYLVELINRSLVMKTRISSLGGTKACRIHDMLRDLCLKKAKEENFMQLFSMNYSNRSDSLVGKQYRLCVHSPKQNFIQLTPCASHVHSLQFFSTDNTIDNKSYDISSIFQDFNFLRVLDLEPITANIFPGGTDWLLGLNYLAIKGNIKSVPSSISNIWNLETLIVKGTRGDVTLPSSLWSMEMLRHVYVRPQASLILSSPELENAMVLVNLTTFSSPVLADRQNTEKMLKKWIRLKKLRCVFLEHWDSSRKCNVFPSLELLSKLESLNMYSGGRPLPAELTFPLNLKKLTLSRFCLPWDYISVISRLSNLVVLKLLFKAFIGDTWEMTGESFPKLKVLKLENLNLANWINSLDCADHFPELERLVFRNCKKLGEVPSSFGEVQTLQMIEVNWCSQSAAKSMETIMDQQLDFGNQDFQVMITPSEWDFRTSS